MNEPLRCCNCVRCGVDRQRNVWRRRWYTTKMSRHGRQQQQPHPSSSHQHPASKHWTSRSTGTSCGRCAWTVTYCNCQDSSTSTTGSVDCDRSPRRPQSQWCNHQDAREAAASGPDAKLRHRDGIFPWTISRIISLGITT